MKREFGKKLIEEFFPRVDLTHVIDTSGAYIPGHGTPTVILFARNQKPVTSVLRTVMGIRGEPSTPDDASKGLVWSAIVAQIDLQSSQSAFVSTSDSLREPFNKHPWSIGGGGAAELKERLDDSADSRLADHANEIGFVCITKADEFFMQPLTTFRRSLLERYHVRSFGIGEQVRDWVFASDYGAIFPYDDEIQTVALNEIPSIARYAWPYRTELGNRIVFGGRTYFAAGKPWHEYGQIPVERAKIPISIVFGEVATHNHFVLDRGGKVFKQTAPVIKLSANATEDEYLALLGLLNSSTACFWMKQVCFPKGTTVGDISKEKGKAESNRFAFSSTALGSFPLPKWSDSTRLLVVKLAKSISQRAEEIAILSSEGRLKENVDGKGGGSLRSVLEHDAEQIAQLKEEMIFLQEELDWVVYGAYSLAECLLEIPADDDLPRIAATERPFCRHGVPTGFAASLRDLWKLRREIIDRVETIRLIETPVYKRPWTGRQGVYGSDSRTVVERQRDVQESWLLARLESYFDFDGRMNDAGKPTARLAIGLIYRRQAGGYRPSGPGFPPGRRALSRRSRVRRDAPRGRTGRGRERPAVADPPLQALGSPQARGVGKNLGAPAARRRNRRPHEAPQGSLRAPDRAGREGTQEEAGRQHPRARPSTRAPTS